MTKQLKRTRANKPQPKGDSGYGQRKNMPWSQRHEHHELPVFACPFCKPRLRLPLRGES